MTEEPTRTPQSRTGTETPAPPAPRGGIRTPAVAVAPPASTGTITASTVGMGGVRGTAAPAPDAPGTVSPTGSGQDVRHRGWYWHWNTLITQYAPLLGLKGVGLLNSYTVWTDRREGSPHHGYAFPAQESEAHFYGEGREELITLNKLLVALDLIEIHKEMVQRQDARGRRWRVPHNFYRVKDPRDGLVLSLPAVVRVLELAQRDKNVFRHIRHIFWPQFAPIDRTSLWHVLLPQLRELPLWVELAERAARERRAPRKTTHTNGAEAADSKPDEQATSVVLPANDAAPRRAASAFTDVPSDEARTFSTFLRQSTVPGEDNQPRRQGTGPSEATAVDNGDTEAPFQPPAPPIVRGEDADIHSMGDEGTAVIEGASTSIVRLGDRMYHQEGKTEEETTRTTSTNESSHARARTRGTPPRHTSEAGRPKSPHDELFHGGAEAAPAPDVSRDESVPPRPAVSELFTAMAERNRRSQHAAEEQSSRPATTQDDWATRRIGELLPSGDEPPSGTGEVLPAAMPAATDSRTAPFDPHDLPNPDTAPGQPLPPTPGEAGIVVRALDVRDAKVPPPVHVGQFSEVEAALRMANGREPSEMELLLLSQVAQDCDEAARSGPGPGSGAGWVLAAIWEAVKSGSSFVAPKRVRAICERWITDGYLSDGRVSNPSAPVSLQPPAPLPGPVPEPAPVPPQGESLPQTPPDFHGTTGPETPVAEDEGMRLWGGVLRRLEGVLHADALASRAFTAARVATTAGGSVTVQTDDDDGAARLGTYRGLIARRLADVLGRAVTDVRFVGKAVSSAPALPPAQAHPERVVPPAPAPLAATTGVVPSTVPTFTVPGTDHTNDTLWENALRDLRGNVSDATFRVWLQPTALIATDADGTLVVGARNRVQRERLERQHTGEIAATLATQLRRPVAIRIVVIGTPEGDAR